MNDTTSTQTTEQEQAKENLKHDQTYKLFFSDPELVWSLVQYHLDLPDKDKLRRDTLRPCKTEYVLETLNRTMSDMAWELAWEDGRLLRFFIVLEFQSYPLKYMAIRALLHKTMIWDRMIANKEIGNDQKLPLVIDVVLHNGPYPWTKPTRVRELVEPVSPALQKHIPDCEYLLLDMRHIKAAGLGDDPVSFLIKFEQAKTLLDFITLAMEMTRKFIGPAYKNIRKIFAQWIRNIGLKRAGIKDIPEIFDKLEEDSMIFCEQAPRLFEEYRQECINEGLRDGRIEGLRDGRVEACHDIAMNMYRKNYSFEAIADITGLTTVQIDELVKKSNDNVH